MSGVRSIGGLSVLLLLCGCASSPRIERSRFTGLRHRVGVVSFLNKSGFAGAGLGTAAADILITELTKTGKFIVVERRGLSMLLDEQKLGASGIVAAGTAAEMGKIMGLNAIVTGSISSLGESHGEAQATVDVRVVDVETGRVIYADGGKGAAKGTLREREAVRAAIAQLVRNITSEINRQEWSCVVAEVKGKDVYLDAGRLSGLRKGQKFVVYGLGREIRSPRTGDVIGRTQTKLGQIKVVDYFGENGAVARFLGGGKPTAGDLVKLK